LAGSASGRTNPRRHVERLNVLDRANELIMTRNTVTENPLEVHQNAIDIVAKGGVTISTDQVRIELETGEEVVIHPVIAAELHDARDFVDDELAEPEVPAGD